MRDFLIEVEDVFEIKGRGLILAPLMSIESDLPKSVQILLIRPDGSHLQTQANFEISHFRFSNVEDYAQRNSFARVIVLKGLAKAEVPIGTKIWLK